MIQIKIWGDRAQFTQPHFRADAFTYPMMTPSAAKGILRSLYAKPEFEWEIESIRLCSPIQYETMKTKGVQNGRSWLPPEADSTTAERTLRTVTCLRDVCYVVTARVVANQERAERTSQSYFEEAYRRFQLGQEFRSPCLGVQDYPAKWVLLRDEGPPAIPLDLDLGSMLFDLRPVSIHEDRWVPLFFHAKLRNGVLHVPKHLYDKERANLMAARSTIWPVRAAEAK